MGLLILSRKPFALRLAGRADWRRARRMLAAMLILALAACANQKPTQSGFLASYADLKPIEGRAGSLATRTETDLTRYAAFMIDPVDIRVPPALQETRALAELATILTGSLREELGKDRREATSAAPDVLRIKVAITQVTKAKPALNVALLLIGPPLFNGGLSVEAEVTDARTGKRVAALSWADEGRLNPLGYYTEYGHPKALTKDFAGTLAKLLAATKS
jgi:hypothetical protein